MTRRIFTLLLTFIYLQTHAQNDFKGELKKLADIVTQQIKQKGNKRCAVVSFTDMQNNETELGKYLAQQFNGMLFRNGLDLVDRRRIDVLMNENQMSAKGLLDPKTQVKLGELAGIEVIIVGSTTPLEKTIELVISGIDIAKGSSIAAAEGSIPRTDALNNLLSSSIVEGERKSAVQNIPPLPNVATQDNSNNLMGDKKLDLLKESCFNGNGNQGQVCFENQMAKALVLYAIRGVTDYTPDILIGKDTRNCSPLIFTGSGYGKKINFNTTYQFYFHTTEEDTQRRYGKMSVVVEGSKLLVRVINPDRLYLSRTKPD